MGRRGCEGEYEAPNSLGSTSSFFSASASTVDCRPASTIAQQVVNAAKNRFPEGPLPLDAHLLRLETFLPPSGESYINASFADLYSRRNGAIIAQAPMPETCREFWTMIWERDAGVVVSLNAVDENDGGSSSSINNAPRYWPETKGAVLDFPPIRVEKIKTERFDWSMTTKTTLHELRIKKEEESKSVKLFDFSGWKTEDEIPESAESFLALMVQHALVQVRPGASDSATCKSGCNTANDTTEAGCKMITLTEFRCNTVKGTECMGNNTTGVLYGHALIYYFLVIIFFFSQTQTGDKPFVVHCLDGISASGFYIAAFNLLEKLKSEKVVDVVWSVLTARLTHPRIVFCEDQIRFLVEVAKGFMGKLESYCNFN